MIFIILNLIFIKVAASVNAALKDVDPSIEIISEPGRYYVDTSFTLSARIIGKKIINEEKMTKKIYYVNEGTYGSFIEELLNLRQRIPISLSNVNIHLLFLIFFLFKINIV